jgi:hypothetical protein
MMVVITNQIEHGDYVPLIGIMSNTDLALMDVSCPLQVLQDGVVIAKKEVDYLPEEIKAA